jgi:DNA polymerase
MAPVLNPLQRAWLRELGMEKVWLRDEASGGPPQARAGGGVPSAARAVGDGAAETAGANLPGGAAAGVTGTPSNVASSHSVGTSAAAAQAPAGGPLHAGSSNGATRAAGAVPAPEARPGGRHGDAPGQGPAVDAQSAPAPAHGATTVGTQTASVSPAAAILGRPVRPASPAAHAEAPAQVPPTEQELAALDLDGLRDRVVACTACTLCRNRRQAVFGMGPQAARWLVVGEAPGEQEDRQGLPFVGRSGQLLDAMLASVGMSRERDVFIANVIKCRPPGNRNPKPEEIAACGPYLMRQIELLKPERILVLGRFAAQTLLGTDAPIGSLRGRVHIFKAGDREIPVVVSYHPAYLLRSPGEKARTWQDLRLAISL